MYSAVQRLARSREALTPRSERRCRAVGRLWRGKAAASLSRCFALLAPRSRCGSPLQPASRVHWSGASKFVGGASSAVSLPYTSRSRKRAEKTGKLSPLFHRFFRTRQGLQLVQIFINFSNDACAHHNNHVVYMHIHN